MEFLYEYGLFLAKAVTAVLAILITVGVLIGMAVKQRPAAEAKGELEIHSLSQALQELKDYATRALVPDSELKAFDKARKKLLKKKAKSKDNAAKASDEDSKASSDVESSRNGKVFVLDFKGSVDANETEHLRREITAILSVADTLNDEVVVRLESPGGYVHSYGLAASQLQRLRDAGLYLTVCVDQVAASGGYMMACVAHKIVSAKFAVIGSVGVVAQLPNFHKVLKKNDIDIELHTAGEYKRTLTMIGENTDEARDKFKADLNQIHVLFKNFIKQNREGLDVDKIATGETWYGTDALEVGLVDEISTSDDVLLALYEKRDVYSVKYTQKKTLAEKLGFAAEGTLMRLYQRIFAHSQTPIS